uniref:Adenylylsulfate reductase membrane anchor n=1 Tax=uncultured Thiotrichaceae bacterium TaxID=298394 RepID=A0A6S6TD61_9GAMM|nr:MAG: Adenylylsulfate reductase membrane anchor [uncultured Thiotrichaceae bacterium]
MLTTNPFTEISAFISPEVMQGYVVLMILLVIGGTVLDMMHKQSARYFFENSKKAQKDAKHKVDDSHKVGLAVTTIANEVLTSSEFCNKNRRLSHLMTMYGFVFFVVTTFLLIFRYTGSGAEAPGLVAFLWHLGALSLCVGGYWFWFDIRVDVASEGVKWYQFNGRGDLFILGLLSTATFALLWSFTQSFFLFALFILSSTVLFGSVYWSKFAHMFFKPAAAYDKKLAQAQGTNENLPADYDLTDPELQAKFPDIPQYMGKNPPNMGLGIKNEAPRHF